MLPVMNLPDKVTTTRMINSVLRSTMIADSDCASRSGSSSQSDSGSPRSFFSCLFFLRSSLAASFAFHSPYLCGSVRLECSRTRNLQSPMCYDMAKLLTIRTAYSPSLSTPNGRKSLSLSEAEARLLDRLPIETLASDWSQEWEGTALCEVVAV